MKRLLAALATAIVIAPAGATANDSQCLASAIHYESGGESLAGKRAVYEVIRNRMKEQKASACGVISQPGQFSWYGYKPVLPYTKEMQALLGRVRAHVPILDSTSFKWFFTTQIRTPKWARSMDCRIIGNHKFCKKRENNGSNWEVRDQGTSAEEIPKLGDGDRLHDLRD